jgi:acyl-CoA dehydrogenase
MQGLGSGAITLDGSAAMKAQWLPRVARGEAIAAFALSEPDAGSDVAAMQPAPPGIDGDPGCSTARRPGSPTAASPTSTCVFARSGGVPGARGISAFVVAGRHAGLRDRRAHRRHRAAPAGPVALHGCRVPRSSWWHR